MKETKIAVAELKSMEDETAQLKAKLDEAMQKAVTWERRYVGLVILIGEAYEKKDDPTNEEMLKVLIEERKQFKAKAEELEGLLQRVLKHSTVPVAYQKGLRESIKAAIVGK